MDNHLKLSVARGAYSGRRCFLMGHGPSLNQMDLEPLRAEIVWGFNRCHLLFDRIDWRPSFYVARDPRVIENSFDEINKMIRDLKKTHFFFPSWASGQFPAGPNVSYFNESASHQDEDRFSSDASQKISVSRTVTVTALQLAVYLGFNPIYLIGCDMSYTLPLNQKPGEVFESRGQDLNHFTTGYLGEGQLWQVPDADEMLRDYFAAKKYCDSVGVEVVNATLGGRLETFRRVSFEGLFGSDRSGG